MFARKSLASRWALWTAAFMVAGVSLAAFGEDGEPASDPDAMASLQVGLDTVWTLATAFLVFFMNAGFGCLEAGFCRAKNAVNILGKNFVVFGISALAFWVTGFAIMFGDGNDFLGWKGWFLGGADNSPASGDAYQGVFNALSWTGIPLTAKYFFQAVFAGTAATIVSGCVAERIHYRAFMLFSVALVALFYPITGHWIWGGGWLSSVNEAGFWDFAGSTVVHSVGGWAGLAGIIVLGPRLGKFRADGGVQPIPGHSMGLVFIGGMILWLGWFGFNPGSTMGVGDGSAIAHIVVTTNSACAAGLLASTLTAWFWLGKPDFTMTVNGALAGLVAITAPCAFVTVPSSIVIGAVAGVLVVFAVVAFDRLKVDDPVGALSVHLVNGIWGTLALGIFATTSAPGGIGADGLLYGGGSLFVAQVIGVVAVGAFTFVGSFIIWQVIKTTLGMRVSPEEESMGLDLGEMGMEAYATDPIK